MERNFVTIGRNKNSKRAFAAVCCVLVLLASSIQMQKVSAASNPTILLDPTFVKVQEGQNLTVTINLTDDSDLFLWQAALEYNGSILNLTDASIPGSSVFAGHNFIPGLEPKDKEATGEFITGLNWTFVGASLLGDDFVHVSNGILFQAQFTALVAGATTITLMTIANAINTAAPGTPSDTTFYTFVWDSDLNEYNRFQTIGSTVVVGNAVVDIPPAALFTVVTPTVDYSTNDVIPGLSKSTEQNPVATFANYTTLFNATASYAPVGSITQYIWDFGDGNVTVVNATGPDSAYMTHVYEHIGTYIIVLSVVGSGIPAENLPPLIGNYTATADVGMVLPLYDWTPFIYAVGVLFVAAIVFMVARSAVRRVRTRRKLKEQKMLTAGPAGQPTTRAQTT